MGLGHILPNRVLTCHLSSLTSYIGFHSIEYDIVSSIEYGRVSSIEYDKVSLQLEPFHLLTMIGVMCLY
jgi:hypothetical protein